jgi:hypothetical protein
MDVLHLRFLIASDIFFAISCILFLPVSRQRVLPHGLSGRVMPPSLTRIFDCPTHTLGLTYAYDARDIKHDRSVRNNSKGSSDHGLIAPKNEAEC